MTEKKSYYKKKGEFKPKVEYKPKRGNTDGSGFTVTYGSRLMVQGNYGSRQLMVNG